jgi:hypothetical protein
MSASNDFSSIAATATGGSVWFADTNAVVLNAISGTSVDIQTGGPLTQSAGVINTPGALTLTTAGGATLNNANTVASLSATNTGSGGVSFTNSGALSAAVTNTPSTGTVKILNTGNLTLSGAISSGAPGDAVVLSTTGNFLNPSNFNINLTGAGTPRWLIYSTSPAANNDGALLQSAAMFQQYGASYPTAAAQSTGDGFLYSASSIPVAVTLSGSVSKVYDGSAAATLTSANYALGSVTDGMFGASTGVALTSVGTGTYDTPNAGTGKLVTSTGGTTQVNFAGGKTIYGYQLGSGSAAIGTITPAPVTVTTVNASLVGSTTKVYDGTTAAVLTPGNFSLTGFVGNDNANVTQTTGTYAGKNVGTGLSVSATLAPTDFSPVGGTILSNYVLPTTASGNIGTITPRPLGVAATAASKVFDGTTVATVTGYGLSGFVVGETVGATSSSANFDTKDVGNGKTVTIAGISLVNGTGLASNYSVVNTTTAQANITAPATTNPPPPVPVPPITVPPVRTVTPSPTPTDFFVTFLEKFEVAVLDQEHRRGRKVNANSDVVVEGELCRP